MTSPNKRFTLAWRFICDRLHMWTPQLNAILGSLVVTIGFWLMWGEMPFALAVVVALCAAGFLVWQGSTIAAVWAWATLLLGMESLAWPIVTMARVRMAAAEPTEQQMGQILTAVLFGLFSSIFWLTFAYGIFKWARRNEAEAAAPSSNREPRRHVGQKPR